jgi:hypothetical protein
LALDEKLLALSKPKLLIVDELGYLPLEPDAAHLFFQLVSRRWMACNFLARCCHHPSMGRSASRLRRRGWGGSTPGISLAKPVKPPPKHPWKNPPRKFSASGSALICLSRSKTPS